MDGSQNPAAILRGGFVGASIARPQDSAPSRPHPTACGVLPTDPVWARRPKPTRPAETERPPLSFGTPHAEEPQGSWSPDFSVRVVTQTRGGAGRKQNGLPRQLAGVPPATRALKVSISLAGDRSPQRHRGCREDVNHFHAAGKVA